MSRATRYWDGEYEYKRILEILDDYWITSEDEIRVNVEMQFLKGNGEFQKKCITWVNPQIKQADNQPKQIEDLTLPTMEDFEEAKEGENIMDEIVWFGKERVGNTRKSEDVSIKNTKSGVSIIVRNNLAEEISESMFFRIGFGKNDRNRLYFMSADKVHGWKFSRSSTNQATMSCMLRDERMVDGLRRFEGDYNLEISDDNMFYIDRRNVL